MAYNIDTIVYLSGSLTMDPEHVKDFAYDYEGELPEMSFIQDADAWDGDRIVRVWWCGQGSGRSFPILRKALELTRGEAALLIVWEGGDNYTGLRVTNGVVVEHHVMHALGEPK